MRVQTFLAKIGCEALAQMDKHISEWMENNGVEPKLITQSCGYEEMRHGDRAEPVVITSIWY